MFSRFRKPRNEPVQDSNKNEFDEDSAYSILLKKEFPISSTQGVLMMCTGGIHAFLMMEYLERSEKTSEETNKFVRSFVRLDFGPKNEAHILLGKGRLRVTTANMETEEGTEKWEKWEKSIEVGPHWDVEVEKVKRAFSAAVGANDVNLEKWEVFTNEKLQILYSLPGDSSGSSMPKSVKTDNCVTFTRKFMTTYYKNLGLTEDNVKILNGKEKYVPLQSPWPMVRHYGNKQEREILL